MRTNDLFERLIERLDVLDHSTVQGYLMRLSKERGMLETIFHTIREGVLIVDRDLTIRFVNAAAVELLGLPANAVDGQRLNRYLRDLDWESLLSGSKNSPESASRQELEVFYPTHRFIQFYMLPLDSPEDSSGEPESLVVILRDVTDEREETDSIIETEKLNAITTLAASVAHEIGNPLNSLTIHLQLLERWFKRDSQDDKEEAQELVGVALREVARLDTLINQFLKAIRPATLEFQPLSLTDLVNETLKFLSHEIEDRGISVEASCPDHLPSVQADPTQLRQALYNIIINAFQAMNDGGTLAISISHDDDSVTLSISDTGHGIPADKLASIFTPYYTTKEEGTGLGLMIVERIIRDHGATLAVDSDPEKGTIFTIRFPRHHRQVRLLPDNEPHSQ